MKPFALCLVILAFAAVAGLVFFAALLVTIAADVAQRLARRPFFLL